mmetsp:Transcript_24285/g.77979  ORF Transcript_24285/g.77979 Transcript_24285/m.77979 type:complete len:295 (-) Transcript_24285:63-947(-)
MVRQGLAVVVRAASRTHLEAHRLAEVALRHGGLVEHDALVVHLANGRVQSLVQRHQVLAVRLALHHRIQRVRPDAAQPRLVQQLVAKHARLVVEGRRRRSPRPGHGIVQIAALVERLPRRSALERDVVQCKLVLGAGVEVRTASGRVDGDVEGQRCREVQKRPLRGPRRLHSKVREALATEPARHGVLVRVQDGVHASVRQAGHHLAHDVEVGGVVLPALRLHRGPHQAQTDHVEAPLLQVAHVLGGDREAVIEGVSGGRKGWELGHSVQAAKVSDAAQAVHELLRGGVDSHIF